MQCFRWSGGTIGSALDGPGGPALDGLGGPSVVPQMVRGDHR